MRLSKKMTKNKKALKNPPKPVFKRVKEMVRVEGVVPRPQADMTGDEVNRTTEGEDDQKS